VEKDDLFAQMQEWGANFGGRPDHALTTALKEGKGADDDQAHCFIKAVAVTTLTFGQSTADRHQQVEDAVRVHQDNDVAVAFGLATSNILNALLLGHPLSKALETYIIIEGVDHPLVKQAVLDAAVPGRHTPLEATPLEATAAARGRSCQLPESFILPLQACLQVSDSGAGPRYARGVRNNILVAGDVCSRAILIGAILGAAQIDGGCPASWASQFDPEQKARVEAAAAAIAAGHKHNNDTAS